MGTRRTSLEVARERAERERLALEATVARVRREQIERAYEAAGTSTYHSRRKEVRSGDAVMQHANTKLRSIARYLDENHDLAIGILDDLSNKIVGTGIGINPMIRDAGGELHVAANDAIARLWREWTEARPDVTRQLPWGEVQRLTCRTWLRDGEQLTHHVEGLGPIRHRTAVPYSLELLEPDFLPFDLYQDARGRNRIVHGVELNTWGEPVAYHVALDHPGDFHAARRSFATETKRVPAAELSHLKLVRRFHQTRGVTIFHGVLTRLEDLKEYDDSERIAARVASAFTAVITRGADFQGALPAELVNGASRRVLEMAPGMIFDNLLPGETVETISSDRPSTQFDAYRKANERSIAAGTGTSRSSIARDYSGNYSSQRQELVESDVLYGKLRDYFVDVFLRDVYRRFVGWAVLAGAVTVPRDVDRRTLTEAEYTPPATSWIDPSREVKADVDAIAAGITSRHAVIRKRGGDPRRVDREIAADDFTPARAAPSAPAPGEAPNVPDASGDTTATSEAA